MLIYRFLFFAFLLVLPLTSAFSITWTVSAPIVLPVIMFFILIILKVNKKKVSFYFEDVFLILFLICVFVSFFLNHNSFRSNKPYNHIFAYFFTVIVLYLGVKKGMEIFIFSNNISFKKFLVFVSIGVLVSLIFGFSEFVLKNTLNFSFDELIPRPIVEDYSPFFLGKFIRVRSFVEESGHYAFYLELLFPITYYYLYYSGFSKIPQTFKNLYVLLFIVCFILTFSSAGIVIFGTFCLMFFILNSIKKIRSINFKFGITIIFGLFFLFLSYIFLNNYLILELDFSLIEIFQTLTVDKVNSTTSGYDRSYRIENALEIIKDANLINIFFGFGPAAYDTNLIDPVIGLYFVLLFETGLFGLFFFIMFFVLTIINNFRIKNLALRNSLLISLLSGVIHYLFIGNYYYPWIWIVAALINLIARWDQRKLYI